MEITVPILTVLLQGILSFFSPCILPIIPLYMGFLSGGITKNVKGELEYNKKKVIINTIFFIFGISFAFLLLGLGFSTLGDFFWKNEKLISKVGGAIIVLFGLIQLGILKKPFKGREYRLPIEINLLKMNPMIALLMGFTFSFAWSPCVGPTLSTVLIMVSSVDSLEKGLILMLVYTIGFTFPFLLVGIFTTQCLKIFKKYKRVIEHTMKIGGTLMIIIGLTLIFGRMAVISQYFTNLGV